MDYFQFIGSVVMQMPDVNDQETYNRLVNILDSVVCPTPGNAEPLMVQTLFDQYLSSGVNYMPGLCDEEDSNAARGATRRLVASFYSSSSHQELKE